MRCIAAGTRLGLKGACPLGCRFESCFFPFFDFVLTNVEFSTVDFVHFFLCVSSVLCDKIAFHTYSHWQA